MAALFKRVSDREKLKDKLNCIATNFAQCRFKLLIAASNAVYKLHARRGVTLWLNTVASCINIEFSFLLLYVRLIVLKLSIVVYYNG